MVFFLFEEFKFDFLFALNNYGLVISKCYFNGLYIFILFSISTVLQVSCLLFIISWLIPRITELRFYYCFDGDVLITLLYSLGCYYCVFSLVPPPQPLLLDCYLLRYLRSSLVLLAFLNGDPACEHIYDDASSISVHVAEKTL